MKFGSYKYHVTTVAITACYISVPSRVLSCHALSAWYHGVNARSRCIIPLQSVETWIDRLKWILISGCSSQLLTQLIEFLQPQHIKSKDNSPFDRPMILLPETVIPVFTHCIAGHCTNIYLQLDENGMKHKKKYYYKILYNYSLFLQFTVHDPANFQICNRPVSRTIVLALMFASRKIFKI